MTVNIIITSMNIYILHTWNTTQEATFGKTTWKACQLQKESFH